MREILFRAKETFNGEWVEGYYEFGYDAETENPAHYMWVLNHTEKYGEMFMIIPETVGQYTGLTDRNARKLFNGDIVKLFLVDGIEIGVIGWSDIDLRYKFASPDGNAYGIDCTCNFEIIGNIHDNPELLN